MITNFNVKSMRRAWAENNQERVDWFFREAIYKGVDINLLTRVVNASESDSAFWLSLLGAGSVMGGSAGRRWFYRDSCSRVLGVCHIDTVASWGGIDSNPVYTLYKGGSVGVRSINLDDRLGVYFLLDWFPTFSGFQYDVLLTTGEESGQSTARDWFSSVGSKLVERYDWIFEFDRRGAGAVLYQYGRGVGGDSWRAAVAKHLDVYEGSFSDISTLGGLGVKGLNVGVGYYSEHSTDCHAVLDETISNMRRFSRFYHDNLGRRWHHAESVPVYGKRESLVPARAGGACPFCGRGYVWSSWARAYICPVCDADMIDYDTCDWCGCRGDDVGYTSSVDAYLCDECYKLTRADVISAGLDVSQDECKDCGARLDLYGVCPKCGMFSWSDDYKGGKGGK